ncbi:hypothetical protein GCM10027160_03090 [Streptomyces calidiresistens]|uniref:hypothetical protein n=1 Tax=Streptomyces calidiresistens TaxID=1485586 RepID=UPI001E29CF4A|nr:hypothetical protein [Streptomyces calidiresistens]
MHDLVQEPVLTSDPMRHSTWRRDQRYRPGPQFLTGTGRHHGGESLEESRVLPAPDFAGDVVDVVSQPLKISCTTCGKRHPRTLDHLAVTRRGVRLIDVRPEPLIKEADRESTGSRSPRRLTPTSPSISCVGSTSAERTSAGPGPTTISPSRDCPPVEGDGA